MSRLSDYISAVLGPQPVLPYHRTYNWDFLMFFSMGVIRGELLSKFCQDVQFGGYSIRDLTELRWGGRAEFFPGQMSIDRLTVTFAIPSPDIVGQFFRAWREKIISKKGFYGLKNEYKRNVYVWLEHTTYFPTSRYVLKGVYPLSVETLRLSYKEESVLHYSIEFSVDRVELSGIAELAGDIFNFAKGLF